MSNSEGAEIQKPVDVQLREWARKMFENPNEDAELTEWAKICEEDKKPTVLAAIKQFRIEQERFQIKYFNMPTAKIGREGEEHIVSKVVPPELEAGTMAVAIGLFSVVGWLSTLQNALAESPAASNPSQVPDQKIDELRNALNEFERTGLPIEPSKLTGDMPPPILKGLDRPSFPDPSGSEEGNRDPDKRVAKFLLKQDATGIRFLEHQLTKARAEVEFIRTNHGDGVARQNNNLIGQEIGVTRYREIFAGIEQKGWGSPNPHVPVK